MKLECPNCHTTFQVDENHYAALLSQVKNKEFESELKQRMKELAEVQKAEAKARDLKAEKDLADKMAVKDKEIGCLAREIERLRGLIDNNDLQKKADKAAADAEMTRQLSELRSAKDKEISELSGKVDALKKQHELDIANERGKLKDDIHALDKEIADLNSQLKAQKLASENHELELKEQHKILMKAKDEEIERYKDLKSRLSTKMLGETLEQHCQNAFNLARSMGGFRGAYFEKDNEVSGGTKGDFIFRDYLEGEECLSIMFEMKNEDDRTVSKHRNEDFFAKLDKDRREKGCEYAVLVTTLEADNELYNEGIVDVSYRYEKMYVIRPQFFMAIISLLSQASKRGAQTIVSLRKELSVAKAQSIDITHFEERRDKFTAEFLKHIEGHCKKHEEAMTAVDKAIAAAEKQIEALRKIKDVFEASTKKLVRAGEVMENQFTIKKLTHGNPTMRAKFDEARKQAAAQKDNLQSD